VIVFETAGPVQNFLTALSKVPGFQFMGDYESEFAADEDFAVIDQRKGKVGADRTDQLVLSRYYLTMPSLGALRDLQSLWDRWRRGEPMEEGFAPFASLFKQLHALRPWNARDRVSEETITLWQEEMTLYPNRAVRAEVELWFKDVLESRQEAARTLRTLIEAAGGGVIQESVVPEIAYHGLLVEMPAVEIQNLIARREVALVLDDDVMFLRPQSLLRGPLEIEAFSDDSLDGRENEAVGELPIAALFDGMPLQAHTLLRNRLLIDDPDDVGAEVVAARRLHGTAMASLILHGDLNAGGSPLARPLYVRPLLSTTDGQPEHTDSDRLLVDVIYTAVLRMKGRPGEAGTAPSVFLVNLSLGDTRRPFSRLMSPLARLLDYLSHRHNVLFLVSGGNVRTPLTIPDFDTWTALEGATPEERQSCVIKALNAAKRERSILSPAESLNALTIGGQHDDAVPIRAVVPNAIDPFVANTLPNVSSGLGLGHRRMIKPDLYFPGGREYVRLRSSGGGVVVSIGSPQRLYGLAAATPDTSGQGRLNQVALSDGTSSSTALATRAGHQIFDVLMDREGGSLLSDIDAQYYAVVVKALLVHSAEWRDTAKLIKDICGPTGQYQHAERTENSCRFVGFGIPDVQKALECAPNRATLVGCGRLPVGTSSVYRIPLPGSLERVTEPRSLTLTVAWFSPVKPKHQAYRCVRLEVEPVNKAIESFGVARRTVQPTDGSVRKGSVFHEHYDGDAAVPFVDDGHLSLRLWCKEDAGFPAGETVRFAAAVTIQAEGALPIYEEIQQRLRVRTIA
jgi:hypothetical protein